MRFIFFTYLFLGATAGIAAEGSPNFVLFYTDDQGWTDTSVPMMKNLPETSSTFYQTPNLERLAEAGMRFSSAYAPAPTCTPSRISIQFGKTTARLQVTTVYDVLAKVNGIDCASERSIAHILKEADRGYITAHFGKGMAIRRMEDSGYDITDEYDPGNHGNGNFHGDYVSNRDKPRRPLPADDPKRVFSLTRRATSFIKDQVKVDRPFFLMVSHYAVHVKHGALAETIKKYKGRPREKGESDVYAAMIEHLDDSLGAILKTLDEMGIADNTYVIFSSDNGGGHVTNAPLTGGKARMFEGGLRVPTVIRGPGVMAGAQCDVPIAQWDFLPTIHDLSGSTRPLPAHLDGGSLSDLFQRGNQGRVDRPQPFLVFHYPYYAGVPISAIRMGDYKFMRHLNTGETRLHDVVKDIAEEHDLRTKEPEKAEQLDRLLTQYLNEVGAETAEDMHRVRIEMLEDELQNLSPGDPKRATIKKNIEKAKANRANQNWM
ncbi:MAG: sulfatase [Planctomycetes bacterium]|nr:sulfatase [Planctomycetota bacterium]MBL7039114.1 sulfatase [Pirellulaceae bacterium]